MSHPNEAASSSIPTDVLCIRCGYNLRALTVDTPCPECGLAAHRTMAVGGHLTDAPAAWVTNAARGAALVFAAYLGPLATMGLGATGVLDSVWYARLIVLFILLSLHAAGGWLVTSAEPGRRGSAIAYDRVAAWALRICVTVPVAAVPLFAYVEWSGRWSSEGPLLGMSASLLACPALTMLRLQRLSRRVGRARVAEHALIAGCGLSVAFGAAAVPSMLGRHNEWVVWIGGCSIAGGVFWLWSAWTLLMIALHLRSAARQARAAWHAADAAAGIA